MVKAFGLIPVGESSIRIRLQFILPLPRAKGITLFNRPQK